MGFSRAELEAYRDRQPDSLDDGAAAVLVLVHGGVAAPLALSSARVTGDQPSRAA